MVAGAVVSLVGAKEGGQQGRWAEPRESEHEREKVKKQALSQSEQALKAKKMRQRLKESLGTDEQCATPSPWMFQPDGQLREGLRRAGTLCAVYTLFVEPFFVAFDVRPIGDAALVLCSIADGVLALDVVLSFVTGYRWLAADGVYKLEMRTARCMFKYLRTNFLRDFVGALPLQFALRIIDPGGYMPEPGPTFIRILELAKCLLLLRIIEHVQRYEVSKATSSPLMSGTKMLGGAVWACHMLACGWFWTIKGAHRTQQAFPEDAQVCSDRIKQLAAAQDAQYSCALYWAVQTLTTVGFGDMPPVSTSFLFMGVLGIRD